METKYAVNQWLISSKKGWFSYWKKTNLFC